jgi:hypothetical protein
MDKVGGAEPDAGCPGGYVERTRHSRDFGQLIVECGEGRIERRRVLSLYAHKQAIT